MSTKFSTYERQCLAEMPLEGLVNATRDAGVVRIGVNHRLLLNEFARRFDLPMDGISIAIVRNNSVRDPNKGCSIWHWGIYASDRVEILRALPDRRWNSANKCNSFSAVSEDDPEVFGKVKELFTKSVIITENGYRIDEGKRAAEWTNPLLYELSTKASRVNLGLVLEGFYELRPKDNPKAIALHGEYDEQYRTLFDESLVADPDYLSAIEIETRHEMLLFRVPQNDGKPRYLAYSACFDEPIGVLFADSKKLGQVLSQFKETQQRLKTPLVENVSMLTEDGWQPLRPSPPRGVSDPSPHDPC